MAVDAQRHRQLVGDRQADRLLVVRERRVEASRGSRRAAARARRRRGRRRACRATAAPATGSHRPTSARCRRSRAGRAAARAAGAARRAAPRARPRHRARATPRARAPRARRRRRARSAGSSFTHAACLEPNSRSRSSRPSAKPMQQPRGAIARPGALVVELQAPGRHQVDEQQRLDIAPPATSTISCLPRRRTAVDRAARERRRAADRRLRSALIPGASADSISRAAQRGVQQARGDLDLGQLGHRPLIVGRAEGAARQAVADARALLAAALIGGPSYLTPSGLVQRTRQSCPRSRSEAPVAGAVGRDGPAASCSARHRAGLARGSSPSSRLQRRAHEAPQRARRGRRVLTVSGTGQPRYSGLGLPLSTRGPSGSRRAAVDARARAPPTGSSLSRYCENAATRGFDQAMCSAIASYSACSATGHAEVLVGLALDAELGQVDRHAGGDRVRAGGEVQRVRQPRQRADRHVVAFSAACSTDRRAACRRGGRSRRSAARRRSRLSGSWAFRHSASRRNASGATSCISARILRYAR